MAHAIPRADWSQAEAKHERDFYWQYLVNQWLSPGPAVRPETELVETDRFTPPSAQTLHQNGWLLESATTCEH